MYIRRYLQSDIIKKNIYSSLFLYKSTYISSGECNKICNIPIQVNKINVYTKFSKRAPSYNVNNNLLYVTVSIYDSQIS